MRTLTFLTASVIALAALSGCKRSGQQEVLTLAGSTSVHPFVEMIAEEYMVEHPDRQVTVQPGGSTAGIQAVRAGAAQIGMVSRGLHEEEQDLKPIVIARDGIAVIIQAANPVNGLTKDQVKGIFAGEIEDWSEVGGSEGPVRPVTREQGSGTRGAFQELVMGETKIATDAMVQDSNGSIREVISNDPGAVGYISLGLVNEKVKALAIDGVTANAEDVRNGTYPFARPFLFVLTREPNEPEKAFIDYVLSPASQKLLEEEGLVSAK
jgi:phosphate transport system substrate-binding protein